MNQLQYDLTTTPPDAEAVAREEDILWYAAVTAEQVAQAVRDAIKDEPEDWDAATIAKVDYAYKTARDCRARFREAVERRVRAENPVLLVGWVALDVHGHRMADELFVSRSVALREWPVANAVPVFRAAQDHTGGSDDGQ